MVNGPDDQIGCISCRHVVEDAAPVCFVARPGDDLVLLCCRGSECDQPSSVHLAHILERDEKIPNPLSLPINWSLSRPHPDGDWRIGEFADPTYRPQQGDVIGVCKHDYRDALEGFEGCSHAYISRVDGEPLVSLTLESGLGGVPIWSCNREINNLPADELGGVEFECVDIRSLLKMVAQKTPPARYFFLNFLIGQIDFVVSTEAFEKIVTKSSETS